MFGGVSALFLFPVISLTREIETHVPLCKGRAGDVPEALVGARQRPGGGAVLEPGLAQRHVHFPIQDLGSDAHGAHPGGRVGAQGARHATMGCGNGGGVGVGRVCALWVG